MLNRLVNIAYQLLDLGKRNRLLNYKDTTLKTLASLNKNIEEIFRGLKGGRDIPILNMDLIVPLYKKENDIQEVTRDIYYTAGRRVMERRELIMYKEGSSLERVLKSLIKDYKQSITEKGINSLYASFGFITYKEDEEVYKAPLILIPIELNLDSNGVYSIREYEDEILLNPTLRYYFNNLYGIEIPKYDDEALSSYFEKLKAVLPKECEMINEMSIGIYSFYKMNMYNDLMTNKEMVIKNDNIRRILGDTNLKDVYDTNSEVFPVVNCDSSQLNAIKLAAGGRSFCLEGPPGSGKSQTITNIISTMLAKGKKVLFVSEKIAALRVVFENLRRVRLSDFAIELHSNKANKKEFIENLYTTATLPKYEVDLKTRFLNAKYDYLKNKLEAYDSELNDNIAGMDLSLIDLYSIYLDIRIDYLHFPVNSMAHNIYDLEYVIDSLEEYTIRSRRLGYDYRNSPIFGLASLDEEYILYNMSKDLDSSIAHLKRINDFKARVNECKAFNVETLGDVYLSIKDLYRISRLKSFSPLYLINKSRYRLIDLIEKYLEASKKLESDLLKKYRSDIFKLDLPKLLREYTDALANKGLFNKNLKAVANRVLEYRNEKCNIDSLEPELKSLIAIKSSLDGIKGIEAQLIRLLGKEAIKSLKLILQDLRSLEGIRDIEITSACFKEIKKLAKEFDLSPEGIAQLGEGLNNIRERLFVPKKINILRLNSNDLLERLLLINKEKLNYTYFIEMNRIINNLKSYDAYDYLNTYLDNKLPIENLAMSYKKEFIYERIDFILENSRHLKGFDSDALEKEIKEFRELDEKILNINRDYIISTLSRKRPTQEILEGSEFKILAHEHEKLRRQMPIRSLLEKAFRLILDIKPVFLMSPLSVSTYLASELNMFDIVIFDEASQIFASDALGSIYRAKQCIIIGDTKQMPPSNFFHASMDYDDDIEYDLESILDKASNLFYTTRLKWHYRSRSEELIRFSNRSFYDDTLITIPQARDHTKGFGIDYEFVDNGLYDMETRTNPKEAEHIANMVFEHFKRKGDKETLGVVAFSNVQAELIMSLVERKLKKHPEYLKYFDEELDEPFFVKNLETVQGDERDRIIFSICYGYNSEGKFYQRFGPLNNQGGERRLNVAITRAKVNVTVVASIKYTDIKEKTEAKGVKLLRSYLEFAENASFTKTYDEAKSTLINEVKEYVESLGFTALPSYGSSSFKIDLAVKKDDKFILAIMSENDSYTNSISDKLRLEKLVLERLGWKYFKVYSTSWLMNKENEKERLRKCLFNEDEEPEEEDIKRISYLKVDEDNMSNTLGFLDYTNIDFDKGRRYLHDSLERLVSEIIKLEAPIHREYIYLEVARIMGYEKPNSHIKDSVDKALPQSTLRIGDFFYQNNMLDIKLRLNSNRDMNYIAAEELANGLYVIIKSTSGITADGAIKSLSRILGYEKLSANGKRRLTEALDLLISNERVYYKQDYLYIKR